MTTRFGRETRVKFLGGELIFREKGASPHELRQYVEGIRRRALDLRRPFEMFRPIWQQQIRRVFDAEGLPARWPALSPAYESWKQRRFPGKTIMRRTDRLYDSLVGDTRDTIWETTPRTIRFGTRVEYEGFHREGRGRLPVRRTLVLLPETFSELNRIVVWWVTRGEQQ